MRHLPTPEAYEVTSTLLAGGYPGGMTLDGSEPVVRRYERLGVTLFVDLTHPADPLPTYERDLVAARRSPHPIVDLGTPTLIQLERILDEIDAALADDDTVYVHCWGGIGRTGTVVGCWLVRHGLDAGDAIARIAELRRPALDASMPSPQTAAQRALIRSWRRGR
jgi:hypothetical protein